MTCCGHDVLIDEMFWWHYCGLEFLEILSLYYGIKLFGLINLCTLWFDMWLLFIPRLFPARVINNEVIFGECYWHEGHLLQVLLIRRSFLASVIDVEVIFDKVLFSLRSLPASDFDVEVITDEIMNYGWFSWILIDIVHHEFYIQCSWLMCFDELYSFDCSSWYLLLSYLINVGCSTMTITPCGLCNMKLLVWVDFHAGCSLRRFVGMKGVIVL